MHTQFNLTERCRGPLDYTDNVWNSLLQRLALFEVNTGLREYVRAYARACNIHTYANIYAAIHMHICVYMRMNA